MSRREPSSGFTIVRAGLALTVLLYFSQQMVGLSLRWVDDETWYLLPAKNLVEEGRLRIPVFSGSDREVLGMPPLLPVAQAFSWRFHEMTIVQARLLTVSFGMGAILATFALGRRLAGERVGLVAAAFCAIDNMLYLAGRTVRPEIIVTCLSVAALWLLAKAVLERRVWPAALSGLAVGAAISTHPNGAVAALCGVVLLWMYQGLGFLRKPQIYVLTLCSVLAVMPMITNIILHDGTYGVKTLQGLFRLHEAKSAGMLENLWNSARAEFTDRYIPFVMFPYRVHIALLCVAAIAAGLASRKRATVFFAICIIAYLMFFWAVAKANKTPRYMTCIMPFVTLIWADWLVRWWSNWREDHRTWSAPGKLLWLGLVAGLVVLAGLSPLVGNAAYLWKYRHADIAHVTKQIDELIPPESTLYGGMAFWIGLNHHTYVPYMRMPWSQAVEEYQPTVVIIDDWVMVHGSYPGEWDKLREELHQVVARQGRLLGTVENDFYGDMRIYAIRNEDKGATP